MPFPIGANPAATAPPGLNQGAANLKAAITEGLQSIGNKISEFGARLSSLFSGIGRNITNAPSNTVRNAPSSVAIDAKFTDQEVTAHFDQAFKSPMYEALNGSTRKELNERKFHEFANGLVDSPSAVTVMKTYGLTLSEAIAIRMYSSEGFRDINHDLRNQLGDSMIKIVVDEFTNGLAKLPSFVGNVTVGPDGKNYSQTWRGANLPESINANYKKGSSPIELGIGSSAHNQKSAFINVNFSMTLLLKPDTKGKDISALSELPHEAEVAFPPNIQFTVLSRDSGITTDTNADRENKFYDKTQLQSGIQLVMKEI